MPESTTNQEKPQATTTTQAAPNSGGSEGQKTDEKPDEKKTDNYGYEKSGSAEPPKKSEEDEGKKSSTGYSGNSDEKTKEGEKVEDKDKKVEEPPKDPVTGYDKEPQKIEEKATEPPAKVASGEEFEIKEPGDLKPEEVQDIKDFVKKYKVSKEIGEGLVEVKKAEIKRLKESMATRVADAKANQQQERREWYNELKNDPTFGGEKFEQNIKQVDKVLEDFCPNMRKKLTESKTMLPPYVMRDLANLGSHLYSTESLTQGGPIPIRKTKTEENDPLAFYG